MSNAESGDKFVGFVRTAYKNVSMVYVAIKLFTLTCTRMHSNMRQQTRWLLLNDQ